jgi:hypothetical protein
VPAGAHAFDQVRGIDPFDRLLAGGMKAVWNSRIRSRNRVKRCGWTTAITLPREASRAAASTARISTG